MISVDLELATVNCGVCGGSYAISARFHKPCRDKGESWRCPYPNCNTWWGFTESGHAKEVARLKRERDQAKRDAKWQEERKQKALAEAEHQAARARGYKGALTKAKKRSAAGVCPCCHRTFKQLARHMKAKHPDYNPEAEVEVEA